MVAPPPLRAVALVAAVLASPVALAGHNWAIVYFEANLDAWPSGGTTDFVVNFAHRFTAIRVEMLCPASVATITLANPTGESYAVVSCNLNSGTYQHSSIIEDGIHFRDVTAIGRGPVRLAIYGSTLYT